MRNCLLLAIAAASLDGCSAINSVIKDEKAAEQAVARFHIVLDAGRFDEIYDLAAPEMKAATAKPAFVALMSAIHRKLGAVRQSKTQAWSFNYGTAGGIIRASFRTDFAAGHGTEQFAYRAGPAPALIGYSINSNDLILK
jgi:hypothetical protein